MWWHWFLEMWWQCPRNVVQRKEYMAISPSLCKRHSKKILHLNLCHASRKLSYVGRGSAAHYVDCPPIILRWDILLNSAHLALNVNMECDRAWRGSSMNGFTAEEGHRFHSKLPIIAVDVRASWEFVRLVDYVSDQYRAGWFLQVYRAVWLYSCIQL